MPLRLVVALLAVVARSRPVSYQIRQTPLLRLIVEGCWPAACRFVRAARLAPAGCRKPVLPAAVGPVFVVVAGIGVRAPFAGFRNSKVRRPARFGLEERRLVAEIEIVDRPAGALGIGRTYYRLAAAVEAPR